MGVNRNREAISLNSSSVVIAAACAVVVWRVTGLALTYSNGDPLVIRTLLAMLGLTFLVCGVLALLRKPSKATLLFAGFCICSGLHWGGPLDLPVGPSRTALIFFYLLVSSFLGSTFLLHFALWFPRASRIASNRFFVRLLYAPVIVATVTAAAYLLSPSGSSLRGQAEGLFMLLHGIVSNLYAVVALVLVASYLFRASAVGVETDPWNLTVVALPISFVIALFGIDPVQEGASHA